MSEAPSPGERAYRVFLRAYPGSFRGAFTDELIGFFRDQRRDRRYATPVWGAIRFWYDTLRDLTVSALRQRSKRWVDAAESAVPFSAFGRCSGSTREELFCDVRYGVRMLRQRPGFTLAAVASLALGVGANTTVFSLVHGLVLRPPPFNDADRLVLVNEVRETAPGELQLVSPPNARDWREQSGVMSEMAFFTGETLAIEPPELVGGVRTTARFFDVLGVEARIGRTFFPGEDRPGNDRTVILSHGFWQRRFGGDRAVIGSELVVNGQARAVIGVMPAYWFLMWETDVWVPDDFSNEADRGERTLSVLGRIRDGVTLAEARGAMAVLGERLAKTHPLENAGMGIALWSLTRDSPGPGNRRMLFVLSGVVGVVLLLACANVATMLLARSEARASEIAVRTALGAGRLRLGRQLLTESLVLGFFGALLGLGLAQGSLKLMLAAFPADFRMILQPGWNVPVLAFTFAVAFAASLVFGLAPALRTRRPDLTTALKENGHAGPLRRARLARALASAEVALALVSLVATALFVRTSAYLQEADFGFEADGLWTLTLSAGSPATSPDYERLAQRLEEVAGVESATATSWLPRSRGPATVAVRQAAAAAGVGRIASAIVVGRRYFETLRIPLVRGRDFDARDRTGGAASVIVSATVAAAVWGEDRDPVGQRLRVGDTSREVVAVVGDVVQERMPGQSPGPIYLPLAPDAPAEMSLIVRAAGPAGDLSEAVTRAIREIAPGRPATDLRTLKAHIADQFAGARIFSKIFAGFALLALALAAVGIYGVVSYSVARRSRELGVRMACGARRVDVLRMILRQSLALALLGVGPGLVAAAGVGRLIASALHGIDSFDPLIYGGTAIGLIAVVCIASLFPALRATRVDPVASLRWE